MKQATHHPLVSIVIVNWNGIEDTKICLQHTRKQTYPNIEIIVVDNGSHDDSLQFLRKQKDIVLVENAKNMGFTGGHISGYDASRGEYILLMNNDAVMDPRWVELATQYIQSHELIGALGGRAYSWNDDNPLLDTANHFYGYQNINPISAEGIFTQSDEGVPREVNNVSGSCVMVPRHVIEHVGYLHDPFFAYYEESDLFARMKRAGYKIVYHPELAIWHANGKTAQRKGSTFSYYMMMRNRFLFAVRNFDNWSLRRFLKFYLKAGVMSNARALLRGKKAPIEQAYAKAFRYNLIHGWQAFADRRALARQLGSAVNYNERITREQTGISAIVVCKNKAVIDTCAELAQAGAPHDEIIMVVRDPKLIGYAKTCASLDTHPLRLCIDQEFFKASSQNLGIACARSDWILLAQENELIDEPLLDSLRNAIYKANQQGKRLIYSGEMPLATAADARTSICAPALLAHRSLLVEAGGVLHELSESDAYRALLAYGAIAHATLHVASLGDTEDALPPYSKQASVTFHALVARMGSAHHEALATGRKPGPIDRFAARHYRFFQARNLAAWLFSPHISLYLKLARIKNLVLFTAKFQRTKLATELKHIRNEIQRTRHATVDLEARKKIENQRLKQLQAHPTEITVFIITRDRLEPLHQLLAWLKKQGLRRIVFIDNDSALPPLVDFLKKTDFQVLETGRNVGHTVAWSAGIIKLLLPDDFYIVTDPDIIPIDDCPDDALTHFLAIHKKYPSYHKVGFGLRIDDLPDHYPLKETVVEWEDQFWKQQLEAPAGERKDAELFEAAIDTTFALYKPFTYNYVLHPSIRTGYPYVARHLPWYQDPAHVSAEEKYYRLRADGNVTSWNAEKVADRYAKEMSRKKK